MRGSSSFVHCSSFLEDYFAISAVTAGSALVPSILTASRSVGLSPSAFKIVGATCVVAVESETVNGAKPGLATSNNTFVSSCAKPP